MLELYNSFTALKEHLVEQCPAYIKFSLIFVRTGGKRPILAVT